MVKLGPLEIGENIPDMVSAVGTVLKALDRPVYDFTTTTTKVNKKGKTVTKTQRLTLTAAEVASLIVVAAVCTWYKANGANLPAAVVPAASGAFGLAGLAATDERFRGAFGFAGAAIDQPELAGGFGLAGLIANWLLRRPEPAVPTVGKVYTTPEQLGTESQGQGFMWR